LHGCHGESVLDPIPGPMVMDFVSRCPLHRLVAYRSRVAGRSESSA
jgi:hypothetical protein